MLAASLKWLALIVMMSGSSAFGVTIAGTVTDTPGNPLENARVDHTGAKVIVAATRLSVEPSPNEVRTDSDGHFRVVTNAPMVVIRKPGFESQRVRVTGDLDMHITLHAIRSTSRCTLPAPPVFKTKKANDIDYTANWYYVKTRTGSQGIISGSGPSYSWGAPMDSDVWTSTEYEEIMYASGIVDASGRSANGKYWRSKSIFGSAAQYFGQTREIAEQLNCVMDHVEIKVP